MIVLVGSDPELTAAELSRIAAGRPVTVVDGDVAVAETALRSVPLFGVRPLLRIDAAAGWPAATFDRLAGLIAAADVVAVTSSRPPGHIAARSQVTVRTVGGSAGDVAAYAVRLAADAGVRLTGPARAALLTRAGDDPARVSSVVAQLAAAGIVEPSAAQVAVLCGSATPATLPWLVTDALVDGRPGDLAALVAGADPQPMFAAVGWFLHRLALAAAGASDATLTTAGVRHDFRRDQLRRTAPPLSVAVDALSVWTSGAAAARTHPDPAALLLTTLTRLAALLHPERTATPPPAPADNPAGSPVVGSG